MYRAIDPDELIAQTIVTADLLDWLRAIAGARLMGAHRHPGACPRRTEAADPQAARHDGKVVPD
jgi:hypothetical protein